MILSINILFNADRSISHFIFMEKNNPRTNENSSHVYFWCKCTFLHFFNSELSVATSRLPVPPRRNILPLKTTSWLQDFSETHTLYINVNVCKCLIKRLSFACMIHFAALECCGSAEDQLSCCKETDRQGALRLGWARGSLRFLLDRHETWSGVLLSHDFVYKITLVSVPEHSRKCRFWQFKSPDLATEIIWEWDHVRGVCKASSLNFSNTAAEEPKVQTQDLDRKSMFNEKPKWRWRWCEGGRIALELIST